MSLLNKLVLLFSAAALVACGGGEEAAAGAAGAAGGGTITVTSGSPAAFNGSYAMTQSQVTDAGGTLGSTVKRVEIATGTNFSEGAIQLYYTVSTGALVSVSFKKGSASGDAPFCLLADACASAILVNVAAKSVSFNNAVLANTSGSPATAATLNGTATWN
jgi:hypothetical protein